MSKVQDVDYQYYQCRDSAHAESCSIGGSRAIEGVVKSRLSGSVGEQMTKRGVGLTGIRMTKTDTKSKPASRWDSASSRMDS